MTCREKLKKEHPTCIDDRNCGGCFGCPSEYGYLDNPEYCPHHSDANACTKCWNREIPEEKVVDAINAVGTPNPATPEDIRNVIEKTPYTIEELIASGRIKDSGDRTEFSTGAVRDMHEGKGRCDLMCLDVVARILADNVLVPIHSFQESGQVDYLYDVLRFHTIFEDPYTMFLEVAKHFEEGAKKYGPDNWRKGIPVNCYIDSAVRHYLKYLRGDTDERHDRAFVWNILCCIWTVENMPELNNYRKDVN